MMEELTQADWREIDAQIGGRYESMLEMLPALENNKAPLLEGVKEDVKALEPLVRKIRQRLS